MKSYRTLRRDSQTQGNKDAKIHRPPATRSQPAGMEACESRRMFSTYTVTSAADSGAGSLRDAINQANSHKGTDAINFKVGSGHQVIKSTGLFVSDAVTIDATTQPGYGGTPLVELTGNGGGYGFNVQGGGTTIKGLVLNRFSSGILLYGKGGNTVQSCYIGTDSTGASAAANTDKGIIVQSPNNTIGGTGWNQGNLISGNANAGIQFYTAAASGNKVLANRIGTNAAGNAALANGNGISVNGGQNNVIGGTTSSARNLISGNRGDGVVVNTSGATGNVIQGNFVGTDATGYKDVGNGNYGIEISQPKNTVGGFAAGAGNLVSGNDYSGVVLWLASGSNNSVIGNTLGTTANGTAALGNSWSGIDISNGSNNNLVQSNLISGNKLDGVMVYQGGGNTIKANTVGYDGTRHWTVANGRDGIRLINTAGGSLVGNYIGNNGGSGVCRFGGGNWTVTGNIDHDTDWGITI